jgi:hypothetical protein
VSPIVQSTVGYAVAEGTGNEAPESTTVAGPVGVPSTGLGQVRVTVAPVTVHAPDTVPLVAFPVSDTCVPQRTAVSGDFCMSTARLLTVHPGGSWCA